MSCRGLAGLDLIECLPVLVLLRTCYRGLRW